MNRYWNQSDANVPDTNTRIDAKLPTADRPNDTAKTLTLIHADSATDHHAPSRFFDIDSDGSSDDLDGFVSDVTTVAQSQCEHATDYADIEALVRELPIGNVTLDSHDSLAPYSGPYLMAILVRAFIIEEINSWDETALHDYLRANPSLCRGLGFETLPNQSTFWRAWNERFSEELRNAVQECADSIVTAARVCDVSLPDRIGTDEPDEPGSDDRPKRQPLPRPLTRSLPLRPMTQPSRRSISRHRCECSKSAWKMVGWLSRSSRMARHLRRRNSAICDHGAKGL